MILCSISESITVHSSIIRTGPLLSTSEGRARVVLKVHTLKSQCQISKTGQIKDAERQLVLPMLV